ncbi:cation:dicarboxylate symporter family transporter [Kistimonas asteriae]|uniref:cation:dicarboxylate symporter family transporter n=1 Tax=Kistimonas asteriae TaxID=517724 RepID=UPI001BAAE10F|nr:cation:dicarboxylase symporter family transporter [Kistimonas asteriae]
MSLASIVMNVKFPLSVVIALLIPFCSGRWVSVESQAQIYTLSIAIKDILVFCLPFVVMSFVIACIMLLRWRALVCLMLLMVAVVISNMMALWLGYAVSTLLMPVIDYPWDGNAQGQESSLCGLWRIHLPVLLTHKQALLVGFVAGIILNIRCHPTLRYLVLLAEDVSAFFLRYICIPLFPFLVLGFSFKLHADFVQQDVPFVFGPTFWLIMLLQMAVILLYFLMAAGFSWRKARLYLWRLFPAAVSAIGTSSSLYSMPVLMVCTERCGRCPVLSRAVIPAILYVHNVGSALVLSILVLDVMRRFGMPLPKPSDFILFSLFYALAKLTVVNVPGGIILIAGPILQTTMGFSDGMLGLVTVMYIIFDPFATAVNVTINGAFAILFSRLCLRWHILSSPQKDCHARYLTQRRKH